MLEGPKSRSVANQAQYCLSPLDLVASCHRVVILWGSIISPASFVSLDLGNGDCNGGVVLHELGFFQAVLKFIIDRSE